MLAVLGKDTPRLDISFAMRAMLAAEAVLLPA